VKKDDGVKPSSASSLLAKIEAKLDLVDQVQRIQAIEEIDEEEFVPKSFKSSISQKGPRHAEDIPLPPMELKAIDLNSVQNEILCHRSLILSQKEREEQWIKRLFSLRQKLFASEQGERISNF